MNDWPVPLLRKLWWCVFVYVCFVSAGVCARAYAHDMIVNEPALLKTYGNLLKANESYDEHSFQPFNFSISLMEWPIEIANKCENEMKQKEKYGTHTQKKNIKQNKRIQKMVMLELCCVHVTYTVKWFKSMIYDRYSEKEANKRQKKEKKNGFWRLWLERMYSVHQIPEKLALKIGLSHTHQNYPIDFYG